MTAFTHLDEKGHVRMVDVSEKRVSKRMAVAQGLLHMKPETWDRIQDGKIEKGNVLETARIAGVMAAKKTADLIPMCHPLSLTHIHIDFSLDPSTYTIRIESTVKTADRTGVEMEALTAASVAALTVYDMCKSHDKEMVITSVCLLSKSGGKSGTFVRKDNQEA
jgi:cyclic pyranopterin phosphate synthase